MPTPTDPVVIVSDDPSFSHELQHRLEDEGRAATVQRADASTPETLAAQHPGMLVVHPSHVDGTAAPADSIAEQVQQAPAIAEVPVVVCGDHDGLHQATVKQLAQHKGTVVASSSQPEEVHAKLHDLDASSLH